MIVEVICFGNEVEMLRGRLNQLLPFVDRLHIVESDKTHTGHPKGYLAANLIREFSQQKIYYHPIVGWDSGDAWNNESNHRRACGKVVANYPDDTFIIYADVDEWWEPESLDTTIDDAVVLNMRKHHFKLDWFHKMELAAIAGRASALRGMDYYATKIAVCGAREGGVPPYRVVNNGWHFSSIGSWADVERKVRSFSHTEFVPMLGQIRSCYENGHDHLGVKFTQVGLDCLPSYFADGRAPAEWYHLPKPPQSQE